MGIYRLSRVLEQFEQFKHHFRCFMLYALIPAVVPVL
eukprot:SAG11_NODE_14014_length_628_cov_2.744802_1_plen_36_part_10